MSRVFLREILKQGQNTTVSPVYTGAYGVSGALKQAETETGGLVFENIIRACLPVRSSATVIDMEREVITSRDNRRLVDARMVRDGKVRGQIFVEGRRLVEEVLRSGVALDECLIAESFDGRELIDSVSQRCEVRRVADRLFGSIADTDNSQGIVVIAQRPAGSLEDIDIPAAASPVVVFLKEINNPSNLGAIFRTAEAAGVAGVIASSGSADAFSAKAMRAALGANLRLPVIEGVGFDAALGWARENGLVTTATVSDGAVSYLDVDWTRPRLLVLGSEAHGLSDGELAAVDETVAIPMANGVESLNLAVAAGVLMFEARRQVSG